RDGRADSLHEHLPNSFFRALRSAAAQTNRPLLRIKDQLKSEKSAAAALELYELCQFGCELVIAGKDKLETIFQFKSRDCFLKQVFNQLPTPRCEFFGCKCADDRVGTIFAHYL